MPITSQTDLNFSDQRVRPAADQLARAYYRAGSLISRWNALGAGQSALNVMSADIRSAASYLVDAYTFCFLTEKIWFLGVNSDFISNDTTAVSDGSPADGRPANTTAKVNGVMNRVVEVQNWLFSATESFTDSTRNNAAAFNTVLQASNYGPATIALSDAANFINRCTELKTNYEATSSANLNTLLALAVNPNP